MKPVWLALAEEIQPLRDLAGEVVLGGLAGDRQRAFGGLHRVIESADRRVGRGERVEFAAALAALEVVDVLRERDCQRAVGESVRGRGEPPGKIGRASCRERV